VATGNVTGTTFIGNLTGDVTGNVTGDVTGNLTGIVNSTSVLANGVTATTQVANDNSTKVATTAYANAAASAIPIGDYLPLTGGTLTGALTGTSVSLSSGITATFANISGGVNGDYFRTAAANTDYNLITRDSTGNTLFVQNVQSNENQPIANFRYGSGDVNAGTPVLQVSKDNSHFVNCNVGIGSNNPLAINGGATTRLHAKADILVSEATEVARFEGGLDGDGASAIVRINTSNDRGLYLEGGRSGVVGFGAIGTTDASGLKNEAIRIDNTGNVGIGTDSPSAKLEVNEQTANTSASIIIDSASWNAGLTLKNGNGTWEILNDYTGLGTTGALAFYNGGYRMVIDNGGNVGIGTDSPDVLLQLRSNINAIPADTDLALQGGKSIRFLGSGDGNADYGSYLYAPSNGVIKLGTRWVGADEEGLTVNRGNVGIGTTSPDAKLEIIDTSNPDATSGSLIIEGRRDGSANLLTLRARDASAPTSALPNGQGGLFRFQGFDGTDFENMGYIQVAADGQAVANADAPSFMAFGTSADGSSSPTEKMRITSGGNVGIGTTNPEAVLNYKVLSLNGSSGDGGYLRFYSNNVNQAGIYSNDTGFNFVTEGETYQRFYTNGSERMRITNGGIVNIYSGGGTSEKTYTASAGLQLYSQQSDASSPFTKTSDIVANGDGTVPSELRMFTKASGSSTPTERMRITSGGGVLIGKTSEVNTGAGLVMYKDAVNGGIIKYTRQDTSVDQAHLVFFTNAGGVVGSVVSTNTSTSFNTSSDYRLKEDLQDFAGLDMVSKIPVYDYKWKSSKDRSYGVMAHELQEVLPDAVSGEKDAEEMQGVDYSKIVPLLIKSIQELKAEIDILKAK
jgi:hypothetical protein